MKFFYYITVIIIKVGYFIRKLAYKYNYIRFGNYIYKVLPTYTTWFMKMLKSPHDIFKVIK